MENDNSFFARFFGVFAKGQTYLNLAYLLLAFPLGIFYFTLLITGFSLGIGLFILWIGIVILVAMFALSWLFTAFERIQAISMLHADVAPMSRPVEPNATLWEQIKSFFANPVTWKGLVFLFLKFPIGIADFVAVVTMGSLSLAMMSAPLTYRLFPMNFFDYRVDSLGVAVGISLLGILLATASLHIFNWLADLQKHLAVFMLGNRPQNTTTPAVVPAPQTPVVTPAAEPATPAESSQAEQVQ
ncbi:MAG TPA: sensor domain-containing protein [Longilinea sp.]|nr:sensor domain-containing protein [Longilinea sp.]